MKIQNVIINLFIFSLIIITQSISTSASVVSERPDKPFLSSIPALFLRPGNFNSTSIPVTLHPERNNYVQLSNRNRLYYTYAFQNDRQAPLIFLIPGVGGYSFNGTILYMAEIAFQQGYSVVCLPSSTHWSFALAASESGRTGYLPDDSSDMYKVIKYIKNSLFVSKGISPRQWGLLGYSYGSLDSAFTLQHDQKEKLFNFDFLVMINPPLGRAASISKVDQYFTYGNHWTAIYRNYISGLTLERMFEINKGYRRIDTFKLLEEAFPIDEYGLAWLAAIEFRKAISDTAYIGDILENKNTNSTGQTINGSLRNYLRNSVYAKKLIGSESNLFQLENDSELFTILDRNNTALSRKKIVIFHSTNDFLTNSDPNQVLNQRSIETHIYNFGGHLGILTDDSVISDFRFSLAKLKTK